MPITKGSFASMAQASKAQNAATNPYCYILANGQCISPLSCPHGDPIPFKEFLEMLEQENAKPELCQEHFSPRRDTQAGVTICEAAFQKGLFGCLFHDSDWLTPAWCVDAYRSVNPDVASAVRVRTLSEGK